MNTPPRVESRVKFGFKMADGKPAVSGVGVVTRIIPKCIGVSQCFRKVAFWQVEVSVSDMPKWWPYTTGLLTLRIADVEPTA